MPFTPFKNIFIKYCITYYYNKNKINKNYLNPKDVFYTENDICKNFFINLLFI